MGRPTAGNLGRQDYSPESWITLMVVHGTALMVHIPYGISMEHPMVYLYGTLMVYRYRTPYVLYIYGTPRGIYIYLEHPMVYLYGTLYMVYIRKKPYETSMWNTLYGIST